MLHHPSIWPPRRHTGRWAVAFPVVCLSTVPTGVGATSPDVGGAAVGEWQTWVLTSGSEIQPAPPPAADSAQTAAELAELRDLQSPRSPISDTAVQYWN